MKRYTASQARQNLARLLDGAARGDSIVIERRGARFELRAVSAGTPRGRAGRGTSIFAWVDPSVAAGTWTWEWGPGGLRFAARRRNRR